MDAALGTQPLSFRLRIGNQDHEAFVSLRLDHSADLPIVEPDWLTGAGVVENLRVRASDARRGRLVLPRAAPFPHQLETIAHRESQLFSASANLCGPQLRPCEISEYYALAAELTLCRADVECHRAPFLGVTARTVDSRAVHACCKEAARECRPFCRLFGQRDENAHVTANRRGTEKPLSVVCENGFTFPKADGRGVRVAHANVAGHVEQGQNAVKRDEHM